MFLNRFSIFAALQWIANVIYIRHWNDCR